MLEREASRAGNCFWRKGGFRATIRWEINMDDLIRNVLCGDGDLKWDLMHLKRGRSGGRGKIAYSVGHNGWDDVTTCHTFIAYIAFNLRNLLLEPVR